MWWRVLVIPVTGEAEAGESLEPGRQRLQLAELSLLPSSLGNRARVHLKKQNKKKHGWKFIWGKVEVYILDVKNRVYFFWWIVFSLIREVIHSFIHSPFKYLGAYMMGQPLGLGLATLMREEFKWFPRFSQANTTSANFWFLILIV